MHLISALTDYVLFVNSSKLGAAYHAMLVINTFLLGQDVIAVIWTIPTAIQTVRQKCNLWKIMLNWTDKFEVRFCQLFPTSSNPGLGKNWRHCRVLELSPLSYHLSWFAFFPSAVRWIRCVFLQGRGEAFQVFCSIAGIWKWIKHVSAWFTEKYKWLDDLGFYVLYEQYFIHTRTIVGWLYDYEMMQCAVESRFRLGIFPPPVGVEPGITRLSN